ncbi:hypothetical protein [Brevibacillus porteri]|uniref:hypothetical protein n=1 Tax=Brevibacillus porteri TaxID=2126350 RepID=UPI003D1AD185
MNWLKEIPIPLTNDEHWNKEDVIYSFRKREQASLFETPDFMHDIVLQWVIAPFVVYNNVSYRIATHDSPLKEYNSTILTNLFHSVREVYADGKLVEIRLEDLKPHIKDSYTKLIDTNKIAPLVTDFYFKESIGSSNQLDCRLFEMDMDKYTDQTTYHAETNHTRLWEFMAKLHLPNNEITVLPFSWVLNDRLLESPFLIFLSRYASKVVLTVNHNDLNVRAISFKALPL